jgi:hypothetical protein
MKESTYLFLCTVVLVAPHVRRAEALLFAAASLVAGMVYAYLGN